MLAFDFVLVARGPEGYRVESSSLPDMGGIQAADPETFLNMAWTKAQEVKPGIPDLFFMGTEKDLLNLPRVIMPGRANEEPRAAA